MRTPTSMRAIGGHGMAVATASNLHLALHQGGIMSALRQERGMRAAFDNGPIFQHQNQVRIADGIQAVRDHDARAAQGRKMPVHLRFGDGVQGTGGFVEQQDGRAVHERPCQRDPLPLPAGQRAAAVQ